MRYTIDDTCLGMLQKSTDMTYYALVINISTYKEKEGDADNHNI